MNDPENEPKKEDDVWEQTKDAGDAALLLGIATGKLSWTLLKKACKNAPAFASKLAEECSKKTDDYIKKARKDGKSK